MDLTRIISILNAGGIILFPTETVYGLGCDATNVQALLKIYQVKARPLGKSFPLLVKDFRMLAEYATFSPEQKKAIQAAKRPTTFVLKAKNLSPLVMQNHTAAFRISPHPFVKKIFRKFDRPLVATSANISKQPPLADPQKYQEVFGVKAKLIDAMISAGINRKTKGSRIVNLINRPYKVLRD